MTYEIAKQLPNLSTLYLYGTKVNDLTPLADLKKLESLWVEDLQVKSLKPLAGLNLVTLSMRNCAVADNDFTPLTKLPALKVLAIDVAPATAPVLKKIPTLEMLNSKPVAAPK